MGFDSNSEIFFSPMKHPVLLLGTAFMVRFIDMLNISVYGELMKKSKKKKNHRVLSDLSLHMNLIYHPVNFSSRFE